MIAKVRLDGPAESNGGISGLEFLRLEHQHRRAVGTGLEGISHLREVARSPNPAGRVGYLFVRDLAVERQVGAFHDGFRIDRGKALDAHLGEADHRFLRIPPRHAREMLLVPSRIADRIGREFRQAVLHLDRRLVARVDDGGTLFEVRAREVRQIGRDQDVPLRQLLHRAAHALLREQIHHLRRNVEKIRDFLSLGQRSPRIHGDDDVGAELTREFHGKVVDKTAVHE